MPLYDRIIDLRRQQSKVSLISILVSNLLPVLGVLFLGWDAFAIVLLYWIESMLVGFFLILKMAFGKTKLKWFDHIFFKLFQLPLFFGCFCIYSIVVGYLIHALFSPDISHLIIANEGQSEKGLFQFLIVFRFILSMIPAKLILPASIMFICQSVLFYYHNIKGAKDRNIDFDKIGGRFYGISIITYVAIVLGCYIAMLMNSSAWILVMLIFIKICVDIKVHLFTKNKKEVMCESEIK